MTILAQAAVDARKLAYAPYSGYQVGAAVESASGQIYRGGNVENAAYGSTMCAERVAIYRMIADGHRTFIRIAIASADGCPPCGACLQVLAEFAPDLEQIELTLVDSSGHERAASLAEFLPHPFRFEPKKP